MNSETGWEAIAKELGADYLFWGPFEDTNYPDSGRAWEQTCRLVAQGTWGRIYDLHTFTNAADSPGSAEVAKTPESPQ